MSRRVNGAAFHSPWRSFRRAPAALIATVVWLSPMAGLAMDGPTTEPPAARQFHLGALTLAVVRGGGWQAFNDGTVFGLNAGKSDVTAVLTGAGARSDVVTMDVDELLVRLPGHLVLIDAGLGPKDHGVIASSLALVGVTPADVTDVFITHHHTDHIDGLVGADGAPLFPNAVVRMSSKEWTALRADKYEAPLARAIGPFVRVFEPGIEALPGITPIALYGHTPGHVGIEIVSEGERLVDTGDLAHSAVISLARPDWFIAFDEDQAAGAAMRQRELARLSADKTLVFAPHFPFPGLGHVTPNGAGYVWAPDPGK